MKMNNQEVSTDSFSPVAASSSVIPSRWSVPCASTTVGAGADVDVGRGLDLLDEVLRHRAASDGPRTSIVTVVLRCAKYSAAWPAEFAPPTTYTCWSAQLIASVSAAP